jgi:hypothetical protein
VVPLKALHSVASFRVHDAIHRSRVLAKAIQQLLNRFNRFATRVGDSRFRRSPILESNGMPKAQLVMSEAIVLDQGSYSHSNDLA